jgi:hypothetical protein
MTEIYMDIRIVERNTGALLDFPNLLQDIKTRIIESKYKTIVTFQDHEMPITVEWRQVIHEAPFGFMPDIQMIDQGWLPERAIKKHTAELLTVIENSMAGGGTVDWTIVAVVYSPLGYYQA